MLHPTEGLVVSNDAVIGTVAYALAWTAFGTTHSVLAREASKRVRRRRFGRATRLGWNLIALVQFALVLTVGRTMLPDIIWPHPIVVLAAQLVLGVLGAVVLLACGRSYDMGRFAGITQLRDAGEDDEEPFSAGGPLAYIRHPLYSGSILVLLALVRDLRSAETAVFAIVYILIGLRFEEAALLRRLGPSYAAYRSRVPALLPWRGRTWPCKFPGHSA
jgi:protein-S-isoprenylcysteine O-methyltransferase Ste14